MIRLSVPNIYPEGLRWFQTEHECELLTHWLHVMRVVPHGQCHWITGKRVHRPLMRSWGEEELLLLLLLWVYDVGLGQDVQNIVVCAWDSASVQFDSSSSDPTHVSFLDVLSTPTLARIQTSPRHYWSKDFFRNNMMEHRRSVTENTEIKVHMWAWGQTPWEENISWTNKTYKCKSTLDVCWPCFAGRWCCYCALIHCWGFSGTNAVRLPGNRMLEETFTFVVLTNRT